MNAKSHVLVERASDKEDLTRKAMKWNCIHGKRTHVYIWPKRREVWLGFNSPHTLICSGTSTLFERETMSVSEYLDQMGVGERKVA